MCFVRISEQTVTFVLYIINRFVFITEAESVYCEVRTESLNNTDAIRLQRVKSARIQSISSQFACWAFYFLLVGERGYNPFFIGRYSEQEKNPRKKTALFRARIYRHKDNGIGDPSQDYMVSEHRKATDCTRSMKAWTITVICIPTENIAQYTEHHRLKFHRNISDTPVSFYGWILVSNHTPSCPFTFSLHHFIKLNPYHNLRVEKQNNSHPLTPQTGSRDAHYWWN